MIGNIIDVLFIVLCVVCFGTIIWDNITGISKARRQLRHYRRNFDGALVFSRGQSAENESVSICLRPDGLGRLALLGCVNRWLVSVFLLALVFAATTQAQDDSFDPTESYRATDDNGNTTRITPSALGGYKATDSEGNVTRIRPSALGGYKATDSEGNVTRIRPSALGGYNATDSEGNVTRIRPSALGGYNATDSEGSTTRIKPTGFGSRSSSRHSPVTPQQREGGSQVTSLPVGRLAKPRFSSDADAQHRSAWALGEPETALRLEIDTTSSSAPQGWSRQRTSTSRRRSPAGQDEQERASQQDDSFAAASGKCGDVTTQRIGNFYYHSDGGVTQKVGNFLYGPDGEVTQKIGSFYYHSDGTTTQRIGNFYYDSDGGVTQKIGSFYYHSGGKPCEDGENE